MASSSVIIVSLLLLVCLVHGKSSGLIGACYLIHLTLYGQSQ